MSLLGFDALGRSAIGQIPRSGAITLPVSAASVAVTTQSVTLKISESVGAAVWAITGGAVTYRLQEPITATSLVCTLKAPAVAISQAVAPAAFSIAMFNVNEPMTGPVEAASLVITANDVALSRTGFDYDFQQGGIGHYLEEMERARQLQRITRNPGVPIDRRTRPRFQSMGRAPIAPAVPVLDMQAVARERMAAQQAAAAAQKKRRDEEALLLLAC